MVIERAPLNGQHETNETRYWILPDTERAERRRKMWEDVLRCCLLGFFPPLLLGEKSTFCRGQEATQFSSLFIFSSRQAVTRHRCVLCHGNWRRKDSRLRFGTLTRPSHLVSWLDSNVLISKTLTGSEVLQGILHVAYTSLGLSQMKIETRECNWELQVTMSSSFSLCTYKGLNVFQACVKIQIWSADYWDTGVRSVFVWVATEVLTVICGEGLFGR